MKKLTCDLGARSYHVMIGKQCFAKLDTILSELKLSGKVLIVTNRKIHALYFDKVVRKLKRLPVEVFCHCVPDGESAKTEKELFKMYTALVRHRFDRHGSIVALGGGVVGDVSAFCASTYMRGISFINIPTTLLAQVDSAIGGKTAINLPNGKNLVGTFYQPRYVVSDVSTLKTLDPCERASSLTEVIKYGVIWDKSFFAYLEEHIEHAMKGNTTVLEHIVAVSAAIKIRVVERDERETSGLRAILNFGHTFAHAFEAAGDYTAISHGNAVGLGMIAAARLAASHGVCGRAVVGRIESLVGRLGLPLSLREYGIDKNKVFYYLQFDKKNKGKKITFVLPTRMGKVKLYDDLSVTAVKEVIASVS